MKTTSHQSVVALRAAQINKTHVPLSSLQQSPFDMETTAKKSPFFNNFNCVCDLFDTTHRTVGTRTRTHRTIRSGARREEVAVKVINRTSWSDSELEVEKMVHGLASPPSAVHVYPESRGLLCPRDVGAEIEKWHATFYRPSTSLSDQLLLLINFAYTQDDSWSTPDSSASGSSQRAHSM